MADEVYLPAEICGFKTASAVCTRPAPCPIPVHHQAEPDVMLDRAREAAARVKGPEVHLSFADAVLWDKADAAADAIDIEEDPTGWQPAEQPHVQWGGVDEWTEINHTVWAGASTDPGRVEECLTIALGALGTVASRTSADVLTHQMAVNALRRIKARAELGAPLPAYPRGPHV